MTAKELDRLHAKLEEQEATIQEQAQELKDTRAKLRQLDDRVDNRHGDPS